MKKDLAGCGRCLNFMGFADWSQSVIGGVGATRPLPRDGVMEELHGDPTVGLYSSYCFRW